MLECRLVGEPPHHVVHGAGWKEVDGKPIAKINVVKSTDELSDEELQQVQMPVTIAINGRTRLTIPC